MDNHPDGADDVQHLVVYQMAQRPRVLGCHRRALRDRRARCQGGLLGLQQYIGGDRRRAVIILFINVFFAVADHDSLVGVSGALAAKTVGRTTLAVI